MEKLWYAEAPKWISIEIAIRSKVCTKYRKHWKSYVSFQLSRRTGPFLTVLKISAVFLKFIYSEKATQICEISTVDLSYVVTVKSTVEISQNFEAFSEYMNITQA